jgi:hypothetical protein
MRRTLQQLVLAVLVVLGASLGCNRAVVQDKPPKDPLLTSKKPIEGRSNFSEPRPTSREIPPPPLPEDDLPPAHPIVRR